MCRLPGGPGRRSTENPQAARVRRTVPLAEYVVSRPPGFRTSNSRERNAGVQSSGLASGLKASRYTASTGAMGCQEAVASPRSISSAKVSLFCQRSNLSGVSFRLRRQVRKALVRSGLWQHQPAERPEGLPSAGQLAQHFSAEKGVEFDRDDFASVIPVIAMRRSPRVWWLRMRRSTMKFSWRYS